MTPKNKENLLIMKILSNASRMEILSALSRNKKDLCVNEISRLVGISQSLASHHLAYLAACGVVEGIRGGQTICYIPAKNLFAKKVFSVLKALSHRSYNSNYE